MKQTAFIAISQYAAENNLRGIKRIEKTKEPLYKYQTEDGTEKKVLGLRFLDQNGQELSSIGLSAAASKKTTKELASALNTLKVRVDHYDTFDKDGNKSEKTSYLLCLNNEHEGDGDVVDVTLF